MLINWLIASSASLRVTYQDKKIHSRKGCITFQTKRIGGLTSNQENTNFGQGYRMYQKIVWRTDICAYKIYRGE